MKTLTLNLPDKLDLDLKDTQRFLAAKMYEAGRLSLGQAAELAGLSKSTFAEIMGDYDVSFMNYPISEIAQDVAKI